METRQCNICGETKNCSEFYVNRDSYWNFCKACHKIRYAARYKDPRVRAYKRDYNYRAKYGVSAAEVEALKETQQGLCGICGDSMNDKYQVDHSHSTGAIRGLLCNSCNLFLGHYESRQLSPMDIENYLNK
jgi:ribosome-binding protein aMBF1 (putative translation factor)